MVCFDPWPWTLETGALSISPTSMRTGCLLTVAKGIIMRHLWLSLFALVGCGSTETVVVPGDCTDATTPSDTSAEAALDIGIDSGAPTDGWVDTGVAPDAETGTTCPIKTGGDLCAKVAKYTFSGPQIVDGVETSSATSPRRLSS